MSWTKKIVYVNYNIKLKTGQIACDRQDIILLTLR